MSRPFHIKNVILVRDTCVSVVQKCFLYLSIDNFNSFIEVAYYNYIPCDFFFIFIKLYAMHTKENRSTCMINCVLLLPNELNEKFMCAYYVITILRTYTKTLFIIINIRSIQE